MEQRTLLAGFNFPPLTALEDPNNAVVRLETTFGTVDVELFNADAPAAIAGFLGVMADGEYDATFLHRLAAGLSLAGGLFTFDDAAGLGVRGTNFGVDGAFARPNAEGTLAVRVETGATTTTGEWTFNLADNSGATNWLVIGRVIQGWDVVQQIGALTVADLSGFFPGHPGAGALTSVPITSTIPPTSVTEDLLVFAGDFELVKPAGQSGFFEHRIYYPEGYSWERIFEAIELVNPGTEAAHYQVVVRYETGSRDQVLSTGQLEADRRTTLLVSPLGQPSTMVRNNVPYAYEVWSTRPLAGGFRHSDFGSGVGEAFFNPASLTDENAMLDWTFTQAALGFGGSEVFLVWQNTTGTDATVTLTLYFEDHDPLVVTEALDAHRRGGIRIRGLSLPAGVQFAGARVQATQPIVASLTRYDDRSSGEGGNEGGIAALGTVGGGSTEGVAPGARRGGLDPTAVLNTGTTAATITFYITEEGTSQTVQRVITVAPGRLAVLEGADNPATAAPPGKFFTMRFESDTAVTVGVLTSAFRGTGTGFAFAAAQVTHFADARTFTSPSGSPFGLQGVSIYNPDSAAATYRLIFRFSDGTRVESEEFSIGPAAGTHHRMNSFNQLISGALGGLGGYAQHPYSLEVVGSTPLVAQAVQLNGDGKAELGTTLAPWVLLSAIG